MEREVEFLSFNFSRNQTEPLLIAMRCATPASGSPRKSRPCLDRSPLYFHDLRLLLSPVGQPVPRLPQEFAIRSEFPMKRRREEGNDFRGQWTRVTHPQTHNRHARVHTRSLASRSVRALIDRRTVFSTAGISRPIRVQVKRKETK